MSDLQLSDRERSLCLSATTLIYAITALAFLVARETPAELVKPPSIVGMQLVTIAAAAANLPPPPILPTRLVKAHTPAQPKVFDVLSDQTDSTAAAPGCDVPQVIANAIRNDPIATGALSAAPDDLHTPAGAIAVWNQGWNPAAANPNGILQPLRSQLLAAMAGVDDACLSEEVRGPRFIQVETGNRNFVLVFGSDAWTWKSLQDDTVQPASGEAININDRFVPRDPSLL